MTDAAELQAPPEDIAADQLAESIGGFFWKLAHPAESSFLLGGKLVKQGRYREALLRFKFTLWRQPNRASAWHNLGICHLALRETAQGIAALQHSLSLNPKNEALLFLLATLEGGKYAGGHQPHTTPPDMIRGEFAVSAPGYEEDEVGEHGYRCHFTIFDALRAAYGEAPHFASALDAGCGTGLMGELLRPLCRQLTGIDLSLPMLDLARGKGDYDALIEGDLRSHLLHASAPLYDLIVACNVAPIMGGLAPMVDGAARALLPGGSLMFNTTLLPVGDSYQLQLENRRFAHSEHYLRQLAIKSGLELLPITTGPLDAEQTTALVHFRKGAE